MVKKNSRWLSLAGQSLTHWATGAVVLNLLSYKGFCSQDPQ